MKLKELESLMQHIEPFDNPKIELEQYPTGPHLASRLLYAVSQSFDEFEGRTVIDLGCGTGMLAIGAAVLGASHVVAIDVDQDALDKALENVAGIFDEDEDETSPIDFVRAEVRQLAEAHPRLKADTVIMNPPFGTRQKGVDMEFLKTAAALAQHSIYSLHKSSTRDHICKVATKQLGLEAEVIAQLRYDLPATYSFHRC